MRAEDERFAVAKEHVRLRNLRLAGPHRFDFPALQYKPSLVPFLDEIVEAGTPVFGNRTGGAVFVFHTSRIGLAARSVYPSVPVASAGKMPPMREVSRSVLIARPATTVFGLINDIERYPEFVPGCAASRVLSRGDSEIVATLSVKRGPLQMDFTTRNQLFPPNRIQLQLQDGPFAELQGAWDLTPLSEQGCRASLALRFAFANPITALVLESAFERIVSDLVDAFVLRARQMPAES